MNPASMQKMTKQGVGWYFLSEFYRHESSTLVCRHSIKASRYLWLSSHLERALEFNSDILLQLSSEEITYQRKMCLCATQPSDVFSKDWLIFISDLCDLCWAACPLILLLHVATLSSSRWLHCTASPFPAKRSSMKAHLPQPEMCVCACAHWNPQSTILTFWISQTGRNSFQRLLPLHILHMSKIRRRKIIFSNFFLKQHQYHSMHLRFLLMAKQTLKEMPSLCRAATLFSGQGSADQVASRCSFTCRSLLSVGTLIAKPIHN